ncbi:MAG: T9SS type A sorting domain-containing protein, partial [Saprospiraceae bacterium]|nr:T9SS type A sorting domain-containing protein [Saprospiraceae bacterium]
DTTYFIYFDTLSTNVVATPLCDVSINGVNFADGIVDNERFGMRKFVYHNNTGGGGLPAMQDPTYASEYYQFLKGFWKDGTRMRYGGNAHPNSSPPAYGPDCDFMFPGDTDPCNWGTGGQPPNGPTYWTEEVANNVPYDRRFMQSAGPFTLEAGAVNYITVGIPWARATSGGPFASVELLRQVDDKCQRLFDNCFKVVDGPDAPDLVIQELENELILYVTNRKLSNNYLERYTEWDPAIISPDSLSGAARYDSLYRFEGYQVFQVKDASVSVADLHDPDLARLVAQCDIKNGVDQLVNYYFSDAVNGNEPVEEVAGADEGIVHSFKITEDEFALGNTKLVNHKKYYYIAIAYSHNEFKPYTQEAGVVNGLYGQKKPYLAGRKSAIGTSIQSVVGIPHIVSPEAGGTNITGEYGSGPKITRIEGQGNGGNVLEFTQQTVKEILDNGKSLTPEYDFSSGPINVKVIDPLNVIKANFTLKFIPDPLQPTNISRCSWMLTNDVNSDTILSDTTLEVENEQLLLDYGLSISIGQVEEPGEIAVEGNGFIESSLEFADSSKMWFSGVPDNDGSVAMNWIRAGTLEDPTEGTNDDYKNGSDWVDPDEDYEQVIFGTWAPYRLCSYGTGSSQMNPRFANGPAWGTLLTLNRMYNLSSIDVVITSDKSKWTRCPVIELCDDMGLSEGGVEKFNLRMGSSLDKDGNVDGTGTRGMSWFPGYAINLETGERLNMMFGEDSWLVGENGKDLKWNPTANYFTNLSDVLFGGKHYIYVMGHISDNSNICPAYDEGQWLYQKLSAGNFNPGNLDKRSVYSKVMWVGLPMLSGLYDFDDPSEIPTDAKIRIRVNKPYKQNYAIDGASSPQNGNYPMYEFDTYGIATQKNNNEIAKNALDLIKVVPNPYFAYSGYEENQLDNRVKITNLPEKCTVSIYTVNGVLVRQFSKDEILTSIDWDLKNHAGIPISGGLYIIHIKAEGIGEKVVKWFGTLRPVDLNSF